MEQIKSNLHTIAFFNLSKDIQSQVWEKRRHFGLEKPIYYREEVLCTIPMLSIGSRAYKELEDILFEHGWKVVV